MKASGLTACSIDGCEHGGPFIRGWCRTHYQRWRIHGDPMTGRLPLLERFWSKIQERGPDDCWQWIGTDHPQGYGVFFLHTVPGASRGTYVFAHRFMYELTYGPIPPGLDIDHICRVRKCVNPAHLRTVTRKQNCEHLSAVGRGVSGLRGVSWNKQFQRWEVYVKHNFRHIYGGRFVNLDDAAAAAVALRDRLFTHNDTDHVAAKC